LQGLAASRYLALADPIVQWPRTPPFHGGNTGSNPVRVAPLFRGETTFYPVNFFSSLVVYGVARMPMTQPSNNPRIRRMMFR
jgi:hypothetical protein